MGQHRPLDGPALDATPVFMLPCPTIWSMPATSTLLHLCLLLIVPFVIRTNVERPAYSSIYVFKRPSSSVKCGFVNGVLNIGGSGEGEGGGTDNDVAPWSSCMWCICVIKRRLCIVVWRLYGLSLIYILLSEYYMHCYIIFCCMICFGGSSSGEANKNELYKKIIYYSVNRGTYDPIFLD
jgi:hypothetical protein